MTKQIIEAGNPTAPLTAAVPAAKETKSVSKKVMVLAVHYDAAGKLVMTPIDVEHEDDDQRDLSVAEKAERLLAHVLYRENQGAMMKAIGSMFTMFDQRLYREQFRNFENFCFVLFGTHRIDDVLVAKAKSRVKQLKSALEDQI